jgi:hypothetical protein
MKTAKELLEDMGTAVPMPDDTGAVAQLWELWGKEWMEGLVSIDDDIYMTMNRHGRNYRALDAIGTPAKPDALAIVCTGWGAPLDPETGELGASAPSKHPERRRVTLFTVVTPRADVASRLVMGDDEPTDDPEGGGVGALADALDACAVAVWGSEFTSSLVMQYATGRADGADSETLARLVGRVENVAPLVREALEGGEQ